MNKTDPGDLSDLDMSDLFRMEVETQSMILTNGLLKWEQGHDATEHLRELMRAAHSLKGAARIVGRKAAVRIAHAMEDCFVAAQKQKSTPSEALTNTLLAGIDLINRIAQVSDEALEDWEAEGQKEIETFVTSISSLASAFGEGQAPTGPAFPYSEVHQPIAAEPPHRALEPLDDLRRSALHPDRVLRVTTENLDRLMGLAGEALVTSRWLDIFAADMLRLKRLQLQLGQGLEGLRGFLPPASLDERTVGRLNELRDLAADGRLSMAERLTDLELFDRRFEGFSSRLYHGVLDCRMRPFSDGIQGFHRMVRDVARSLGKTARLEIQGDATPVDRDILERLKAPLDHLVRNSLDHGIESPTERRGRGKPEEGTVQLQACHHAGMLLISVGDDGCGVDPEAVRKAVVQRRLTTPETTQGMTDSELFEFLFLPGFTLKESVSEISGRGVGLDVVQTMIKEVGGRVSISSRSGQGTRFQLELPLTLSVARTLLVEIGGEPFAFPLARIDKALKLPRERIESLQGRQHFTLVEEQIGLVAAHQAMDLEDSPPSGGDVSIIVIGDKRARYGLVIDRFLGERELVVRSLDPRIGKLKNISSAALMPDGSPVLIVDVDDLTRSIENLVSGQHLVRVGTGASADTVRTPKRVLVVDDSLTVRELERKLLGSRGYAVDVAVDGMDGWNAVRTGHYDLAVTDVDMPRLDGIELLKLIRKDSRLKSLPVIIVSYKDRQEDRRRGLEAGADYYLTKASFHDETLLKVVADLVGGAD
jgi:two-component system sensor histidine kinase and response regulator WspE